jgi:hypothetical protein
MYPHERSLVKRLQDQEKRFVFLGINSDEDRDELKKTLEKENITWRSWWDEGSPDGPIQKKWNVTERPAIYVLDARGVIRFKDVKGDELDKAVDTLLAERPAGK